MARGNRSQPPSERTAEERARDREARARRRAGLTAGNSQEAPAAAAAPLESARDAPADPPVVEPPPRAVEEPVEVPHAPAPVGDPAVLAETPPIPIPVEEAPVPAQPTAAPVMPASVSVRRKGRRSPGARVGALVALVAVIAAVWLLIRPLHGSGHPAPVAPVAVVKVVIPEGETSLQIAEIAKADGLTGSYTAAAERSSLLNPAIYGAPRNTPNLEGFLFPATYDMDAGAPVGRLVAEQLTAFGERFGPEEIRRAHALHITPYQLLTVASMVEREAQLPGDRPKIAAVIYNRLRLNIPLGIDATIYYAVEQTEGIATYTGELTVAQLHIDSPYNTRIHHGLPPTPISNPGLASIEAAAHPAHVPYLYYVAGADGCGEQVFSTTFAQFERDAAAYDAAVKRNGGKPPVCKSKRK